ncbi:hypothetical protein ACLB2K_011388 [Fragaria x ananassa]
MVLCPPVTARSKAGGDGFISSSPSSLRPLFCQKSFGEGDSSRRRRGWVHRQVYDSGQVVVSHRCLNSGIGGVDDFGFAVPIRSLCLVFAAAVCGSLLIFDILDYIVESLRSWMIGTRKVLF